MRTKIILSCLLACFSVNGQPLQHNRYTTNLDSAFIDGSKLTNLNVSGFQSGSLNLSNYSGLPTNAFIGSLNGNGTNTTLYDSSNEKSFSSAQRQLYDVDGSSVTVDWTTKALNNNHLASLSWGAYQLITHLNTLALNWDTLTLNGNWTDIGSITATAHPGFIGDGSGLTNLTGANPIVNLTNIGTLFLTTNAANPSNPIVLSIDNQQWQWGLTNGNAGFMAYVPNHGPFAGQGEFGRQSLHRLSDIWGTAFIRTVPDDWQIGAALPLNYPGGNEIYINQDYTPTNSTTPLGYSLLWKWYASYWNGSSVVQMTNGYRYESTDTNGGFAFRFYNPVTNGNPTNGQSPGVLQVEMPTNGLIVQGRMSQLLTPMILSGSNIGVNYDGGNMEIQAAGPINITNVTAFQSRSNLGTPIKLKFYTYAQCSLSTPTNWTWVNEGGTAVAPTNIPGSNSFIITLNQDFGNLTNYIAEYKFGAWTPYFDPLVATFIAAAGTKGNTNLLLNQAVLAMRAAGITTNQILDWYPIPACTTPGVDMMGYHNFTAHNGSFDASGFTGDGTTAYLDTGVVPATRVTSQNSMAMGFTIARTNSAVADTTVFMGVNDGASHLAYFLSQNSASEMWEAGFNNGQFTESTTSIPITGRNWVGRWACNRTGSSAQTTYWNITTGGASRASTTTTTTTGLPNAGIYAMAFNNGGPANYVKVTMNNVWLGQNLTDAQMQVWDGILATFNAGLGR